MFCEHKQSSLSARDPNSLTQSYISDRDDERLCRMSRTMRRNLNANHAFGLLACHLTDGFHSECWRPHFLHKFFISLQTSTAKRWWCNVNCQSVQLHLGNQVPFVTIWNIMNRFFFFFLLDIGGSYIFSSLLLCYFLLLLNKTGEWEEKKKETSVSMLLSSKSEWSHWTALNYHWSRTANDSGSLASRKKKKKGKGRAGGSCSGREITF